MAKRIPLDNVCVKKIPTVSSHYDGLIDYVDISSVDNTEKRIVSIQCTPAQEAPSRAKQLLEVGDILVSTVRPNLNAVAMVEQQTDNLLVGSTGYCVLRCNDSIDKRYVFHFCQSPYFIDDMTSQATGASYPAVSSGIVKSSTIPDHPIEKQKQIADRLDKVSELIALRKEQLAKLDQLVKSQFIELMDAAELSEETTIEQITERVKVGFVGTCEKYYTDDSGIPMLRTGNITDRGIDMSDLKYVTAEFHEKNKKSQIRSGDLLIARHGSNGQANVYDGPEAQCLNAVVIVPNSAIAKSVFLAGLINSPNVKEQIERTLVGSTQHVVNTKSIANLVVRIPQLIVQEQYKAFVEQTDKSKLAIQQSLDKLELLKKSLMQEYFG